jgi:hypothetical protein
MENKRDTTNPFPKSGLYSRALLAPIGYGELSVVRTNSVMFVWLESSLGLESAILDNSNVAWNSTIDMRPSHFSARP